MSFKRLICLILILPLIFPLGCSKKDNKRDEMIVSESIETNDKGGFLELSKGSFILTSNEIDGGATFTIDDSKTRSFSGLYYEVDSTASGIDYDGVKASSSFSGQFSELVEVDEYTYICNVENFEVAEEIGQESIKDGMKYITKEPFGIAKGAKVTCFYPGATLENIPDDFISWAKNSYYFEGDTLPVIGLMIEVEGVNYGWILQTE